MLAQLNHKNDVPIYSVEEEIFRTFGRVIEGYPVEDFITFAETETSIPEEGNCYQASVEELERLPSKALIQREIYGGMPIQIGYCNGKNSTYNGLEYHKGSELNIAVTDFMLVLGQYWKIQKDGSYNSEDTTVFYVPKGKVIELFQTTLHLSPCRVREEGFKDIVILPRGTNFPLKDKVKNQAGENKLLLQTNKWVIAHPDRKPLINQGAFPGFRGENKELRF